MKLRYILTSLLACLALAVGCVQEELPGLSEIEVTPSYFSFEVDGGTKEVTVTTALDWKVTDAPEWVTVTPASGKGNGKFTVNVAASTDTLARTAYLKVAAGSESQLITVNQDAFVPDFPAFAEGDYWIVFDGGAAMPLSSAYGYLYTAPCTVSEDGKYSSTAANIFTFKAVDGGFTIQDPAGQYYCLSGTYNSYNVYAELPETGGVWTVQQTGDTKFVVTNKANGKMMQYDPSYSSAGAYNDERGVHPYLVSVAGGEVVEVTFDVEPTEVSLTKEAGEFDINMLCKDRDFEITPSADWITLKGMTSAEGEYVVTFAYSANEGPARTATIDFVSGEETITVEVAQEGSVLDMTAAEINAAEDGPALYRLTGYISGDKGSEYGNIYIKDATGEVYVYGVLDAEGNSKQWFNMGIKQGDIVTVIAPKTSYNGAPQLKNATIEKHIPVTDKTVAEFLAAEESGDVYYRLTGAVSGLADAGIYGNIYVTDESGESVYVYGLLSGWGGPKKEFQTLVETTGLAEGDIITIVGVRSSYNNVPQVGSAFYVSHEPGEAPVPELSVDGKQWIAEMDGNQVLFDFGLAEETFLSIALPTMDGTGFGLYMAGLYDIEMTDAASGLVTFTQYDWEWDEFLEEMEIQYSELGETSVKFVCESVFGVSDPVVFTLVEEPYEIEAPDMGESPEGAVEDGDYWIIEPTAAVAMAPLAGNYGYPEAGYVLAENGTYASTLENAYTFTYLPDKSYYTIQDSNGKYLYMKTKDDGSWYTSFSVGEYEDNSKYHWVVFDQGDGTYDIYNVASEYQIAYSSAYNSWGAYAWGSGNALPMLVKAENPVEEPEVEIPEGTTVIAMGTDNQTWTEAEHETYGTGYIATVGDYTVAYYQNTNSTAPSQGLQADHIRVYVGSNLVVTNTAGKKIKSLAITCAGGKTGPISVEGVEYSATDNVITWEGETEVFDANCIKQTRVASLTIIAE